MCNKILKKLIEKVEDKELQQREELATEYTGLVNATAQEYTDSSHQLSGALLAAATAYMAIATAVIWPQATLTDRQRNQVHITTVVFLISVIMGIATYIYNTFVYKNMFKEYNRVLDAIVENDHIEKSRSNAEKKWNKYKNSKVDVCLILAQSVAFIVGTILTVILIFSF